LVLLGGWALLSEMTSEAAPPAYDPNLEFKVLAHIPVGDDPRGIAVVGDYVYVANHDDNTLSVIDATTLTVTQVISAGLEPCAIAYNPNNGYLYVTNWRTIGTVTVISITTNMTVTVLGVGGDRPTGIAFNPNDGVMYVPLFGESEVVVISGTEVLPNHIDGFGSGRELSHVAVNVDANKIYVTDHEASDSNVFVINGITRTYSKTIDLPAGQGPWGIAVNQETDWVYVAAVDAGRLVRIRPTDTVSDYVPPPSPASLRMVAVDSDNDLVFVTEDETEAPPDPDGDPEHVFVFDAEAGDWVDEFTMDVQQDPERGIAFDPARHRLYVSNRRSDTVTVIQMIRELYFPIIMKSFS
jgi:YVTN family beta-propeller protein